MKKHALFMVALWAALFPSQVSWAEEIPYDAYISLGQADPEGGAETFAKHLLVYPFELVRRPVNKTLTYAEDHRLYDKASWIYEQLKNYGITPKLFALYGEDGVSGGMDLDLLMISRLKSYLPGTSFQISGYWTLNEITADYRAEITQKNIAGTGFYGGEKFQYEKRKEEHFYGIGPETSLGDGTSYKIERTSVKTVAGYEFTDRMHLESFFAYEHANITNGEDGGRGVIDEIFIKTGRRRVPGLGGEKLLKLGFEFGHDNRDNKGAPSEGGYEKLHISLNKGIESDAGYAKYRAEATHFFKLGSTRRVLMFRTVAEHNDEMGDREVPFFEMARLGGFGIYPRKGDVHRGYNRDRFYGESLVLFNVEYRWTTWEYRRFKMDSAIFLDEGQVFGELSRFQFQDFTESYGLAFRFLHRDHLLLTLEIARSAEGTQFYAKTRSPF